MSFRAYRNKFDARIEYAFEGEEMRLADTPDEYHLWGLNDLGWSGVWEKLPPDPTVILATTSYMAGVPYFDSMKTMHELDRLLNIEAEQAREDKAYQEFVLTL